MPLYKDRYIHIRIPGSLDKRLRRAAKTISVNGSDFVRQAVVGLIEEVEARGEKFRPAGTDANMSDEWNAFKREREEMKRAMKAKDYDNPIFNMPKKTPTQTPPAAPVETKPSEGIKRGLIIDRLGGLASKVMESVTGTGEGPDVGAPVENDGKESE